MKSNASYYSSKSKKKNIKVIYTRRSSSRWSNRHVLTGLTIGMVLILAMSGFAYYYFSAQSKITRLIKNEEYSEAIQVINRLLKENPNDPYALKAKGNVYHLLAISHKNNDESNNLNISIESMQRLIKTKDTEYVKSDVFFILGYNYFLKGIDSYEQALGHLKQSLTLDTQDNMTRNYLKIHGLKIPLEKQLYSTSFNSLLGFISYKLGEFEESIEYFNKAALEKETAVINHFFLATAYANLKNYDKALQELEVVAHRETQADVLEQSYLIMFKIYFKNKDYSQAEAVLKKAQEINHSADSLYQFGLLYEEQNQMVKAVQYWKQAVEKDSSHDKARLKLIQNEKKITTKNKKKK